MNDDGPVYAAECEACEAFGVSTAGTRWGKDQLVDLVQTHLQNCRASPDEIDVVERDDEGDETPVETVSLAGGPA